MNPDSEQVLSRFAAGEMTIDEESEFLAWCEIEPARYRRVALSVVEHRRVVQALQAYALPEETELEPIEKPDSPVKRLEQAPVRGWTSRVPRQLITAASFMGIAIGAYLIGAASRADQESMITKSTSDDSTIAPTHGFPETTPAPRVDTIAAPTGIPVPHKQPTLPNENNDRKVNLASVLADMVRSSHQQPVFDEPSRHRLRQGGWEVNEQPKIYLFSTEDGNQYAVPTRNANIRFVKQSN